MNLAQPCRPWGSTQTIPPSHNRVKHLCQGGHATGIEAWRVVRTFMVASREDRIQLPSEKDATHQAVADRRGRAENQTINTTTTTIRKCHDNIIQLLLQKLIESRQGMEQFDVTERRKEHSSVECKQSQNHQRIGQEPYEGCLDASDTWCHRGNVSLVRSQSEELYRIVEYGYSGTKVERQITHNYNYTTIDAVELMHKNGMLGQPVGLATKTQFKELETHGDVFLNITHYNQSNKNGIWYRSSFDSNNEWGAQCADAHTTITQDNSESRALLGRYQPCALASTFNLGVKVEGGGCKGYQSYGIVVNCFKHSHTEIWDQNPHVWLRGLVQEFKHNVWLKTF